MAAPTEPPLPESYIEGLETFARVENIIDRVRVLMESRARDVYWGSLAPHLEVDAKNREWVFTTSFKGKRISTRIAATIAEKQWPVAAETFAQEQATYMLLLLPEKKHIPPRDQMKAGFTG